MHFKGFSGDADAGRSRATFWGILYAVAWTCLLSSMDLSKTSTVETPTPVTVIASFPLPLWQQGLELSLQRI